MNCKTTGVISKAAGSTIESSRHRAGELWQRPRQRSVASTNVPAAPNTMAIKIILLTN